MKRTDLPPQFQHLLKQVPYVTIATASAQGLPWNTPVVGYFDEELHLYWSSYVASQHSQNIAQNPTIFVVIYDTSRAPGESQALYLQMQVKRLSSTREVTQAKTIYLDRYGEQGHDAFIGSCPRRIYRATPQQIWTNTDGTHWGHFIDKRAVLFTAA